MTHWALQLQSINSLSCRCLPLFICVLGKGIRGFAVIYTMYHRSLLLSLLLMLLLFLMSWHYVDRLPVVKSSCMVAQAIYQKRDMALWPDLSLFFFFMLAQLSLVSDLSADLSTCCKEMWHFVESHVHFNDTASLRLVIKSPALMLNMLR